ncbi:MAG: hypothetical protein KA586_00435 [Candidatus Promineofilum sp.]|nr:hypothetical protein [Promineifilum sp.]
MAKYQGCLDKRSARQAAMSVARREYPQTAARWLSFIKVIDFGSDPAL